MFSYDTGNYLRSKGMFALLLIRFICCLFLCQFLAQSASAKAWKLGVLGGISAPTPGFAGALDACTTIYKRGCLGFSYLGSHNERAHRHEIQDGQHLTGFWEHAFPLGDEYHLFFLQIAAGAGYIERRIDTSAGGSGESVSRWGASWGGGVGFDLPLADLMSIRFVVLARQAAVPDTATQVASLLGVRFGAEWLGFGN